jgi:hypothetical protein
MKVQEEAQDRTLLRSADAGRISTSPGVMRMQKT